MAFHPTMKMVAIVICLLISSILSPVGVCGISFSQKPILTLKAQNGQLYDCIGFYKQPAFNHPSLKNQISKVRPALQQVERKPKGIGLKHGGCPVGSVPILRVNTTASQEPHSPPAPSTPKQRCIAVIQTKLEDSNRKFYGSDAAISLHKPAVKDVQWSSTRIKLSNGQDSIETGWMVNPTSFKDDEAHLYAKFEAGGKGCVNLECPGFVQVSKDVPLGAIPEKYSTIGKGPKYSWNISVEKHSEDGNWWVTITSVKERYPIGYWPKSIFSSLAEAANQVEWGGEIYNPIPLTKMAPPDMGNGMQAIYDPNFSAYFRHVTVNTETAVYVEPQGTLKVYDCPLLYTILDEGFKEDYWGRVMYYGGGIHPGPS